MTSVAFQATDMPDHRSVRSTFIPGTWHTTTSPLETVLADLADRCADLMPLARLLLPRLPRSLLCSNNLKCDEPKSRFRSMERAVRCRWMGMQKRGQEYIHVLMVDCDREDWRDELRAAMEQGLPEPTFKAITPVKYCPKTGLPLGRGHETAHLYWVLKVPVKKANPRSFDLFTRTRNAIIRTLGADPAAVGHLGKNPFHRDHLVELGPLDPVELSDLYKPMMAWCAEGEYFLGKRSISRDGSPAYNPFRYANAKKKEALTDEDAAQWGKLFEARWGVYDARTRDYGLILAIVEEHARAVGSRATKGDIRDTARSIHRYMITKSRNGGSARPGIDYGVMSRENIEGVRPVWYGLSKQEKRKLAGKRSAAVRQARTDVAVRREVLRALSANDPITQRSLAAAAGVGERRIQQIWAIPVSVSEHDLRSVQDLTPSEAGEASSFLPPSRTLRDISILSKQRAARARMDTGKAAVLLEAARLMRKRGSEPQDIPCLTVNASPAVRAAHREAIVARRSCLRRREKRADKLDMKRRRQEKLALFRGWAEAGDTKAYKDFLAAEDAKWNRIEDGSAHDTREAKERIRMRRGTAFKRHRADWDEALRCVRGEAVTVDRPCSGRSGKGRFRTVLDNPDRLATNAAVTGIVTDGGPDKGIIPAPPVPSFLRLRSFNNTGANASPSGILRHG